MLPEVEQYSLYVSSSHNIVPSSHNIFVLSRNVFTWRRAECRLVQSNVFSSIHNAYYTSDLGVTTRSFHSCKITWQIATWNWQFISSEFSHKSKLVCEIPTSFERAIPSNFRTQGSLIHINIGKISEGDILSSDSVAKSATQQTLVLETEMRKRKIEN